MRWRRSWAETARAADKFALDPTHTFVVFKIADLGYAPVVGWFTDVGGQSLTFDSKDVTKSALQGVTIKTASIDTHFAQRNKDLMSPDFLNVAEFPEMTFKSTSVQKTGDKTGKVTGDLTLVGVTKPVTMDVTFNKAALQTRLPTMPPTAGFEATHRDQTLRFRHEGGNPEHRRRGRHFDRFAGPQDLAGQAGQGLKASRVLSPPDDRQKTTPPE